MTTLKMLWKECFLDGTKRRHGMSGVNSLLSLHTSAKRQKGVLFGNGQEALYSQYIRELRN